MVTIYLKMEYVFTLKLIKVSESKQKPQLPCCGKIIKHFQTPIFSPGTTNKYCKNSYDLPLDFSFQTPTLNSFRKQFFIPQTNWPVRLLQIARSISL